MQKKSPTFATSRPVGRPRGSEWVPPPSLAVNYLSVNQACRELACERTKLYGLIRTGDLATIKYLNYHTLISRASIRLFLANEVGPGLPVLSPKKAAHV